MAQSASTKRRPATDRVELQHALYRIVAGRVADTCKAVAYLGSGGVRPVEAVEAESVDAAVTLMKDVLDDRVAELRSARQDGIPAIVEFREALLAASVQSRAFAMNLLPAVTVGESRPMTMEEMSQRTASDGASTERELLKLGRELTALLGFTTQAEGLGKRHVALLVLGTIEDFDPHGQPVVRFHDGLGQAIADLPAGLSEPRIMGRRK